MKFTSWLRWRAVIFGFDVSQDRLIWLFIWPFVLVWEFPTAAEHVSDPVLRRPLVRFWKTVWPP